MITVADAIRYLNENCVDKLYCSNELDEVRLAVADMFCIGDASVWVIDFNDETKPYIRALYDAIGFDYPFKDDYWNEFVMPCYGRRVMVCDSEYSFINTLGDMLNKVNAMGFMLEGYME